MRQYPPGNEPLRIGILGIRGRMGQAILHEAERTPRILVTAGTTRELTPSLGGVFLSDNPRDVFEKADVVLDFSHPKALNFHLEEARLSRKPFMIGTTGLNETEIQKIREIGEELPLLYAPNTSFGIALLQKAVASIAQHLDSHYDVEILDIHHRHKKDAPSGTALLLSTAIQEGRTVSQAPSPSPASPVLSFGNRHGCREEGTIGIASLRGGHLKGEHQVHFIGPHERLVLSHEAFGRELFAHGAIKAAFWLSNHAPGYYVMADVFGLNER